MRRILLAALAAAWTGGGAGAQELALLRPVAVVDGPVLRLGDLFEGLADARAAAAPVAAAPAPGRRVVIEAGQLVALARAHGVAWRPVSAQDRAVVERPGRPVPRADVEAALRAELVPLGMDPEAALDLGALVPPMVPPGAAVAVAAEGASLEAASNRFAATLVVTAEGTAPQRQRVAGRAVPTVAAVVPARRLALGEVVGAADVRPVRLRADLARPGMAQAVDQVVGQQLRRPLGADVPVLLADVAAPVLVEKNALVTLLFEAPGIQLAAQGRALAPAPRGGTVAVANLQSGSVVEGVVTGPGRVRVALGAPAALR